MGHRADLAVSRNAEQRTAIGGLSRRLVPTLQGNAEPGTGEPAIGGVLALPLGHAGSRDKPPASAAAPSRTSRPAVQLATSARQTETRNL